MTAVAAAGRDEALDRAALAAVCGLAALLIAGGFWTWPWDHDEVLSLAELRLVPLDQYVGPPEQLRRIATILPLWYHAQRGFLAVFPQDEFGARVLPVLAALVLVGLSAWWGLRRGPGFAAALVFWTGCSPTLVWLSQQNRFYSLALCLAAAALFLSTSRRQSWSIDAACAVLAMAAILTHNLTLVLFGIGFVAAVPIWLASARSSLLLRRTALMAALGALVYVAYLRPALSGWVSGGTGGTLPIVSLVAQTGVAPVALALVGAIHALTADAEDRWWLLVGIGCVLFVGLVPYLLRAWNPRYALFFMWPLWVLAALGTARIASALPSGVRLGWFAVVALLMTPKLASHLVDGTRHDFRTTARLLGSHAGAMPMASNWPATLQYYLEREGKPVRVRDWQFGAPLPSTPGILVVASNAWEPVLASRDGAVQVMAEVRRRRFDEQSHVIRVYRIGRPLPPAAEVTP